MIRLGGVVLGLLCAALASGCGAIIACQLNSVGCDCYPAAVPNSLKCSEANNPGTICCAMLTFPSSGNCECTTTTTTCTKSKTSDLCHCYAGLTANSDTTIVSSCGPVGNEVCCLDTASNTGYCTCNFATACYGSNKQVSSCSVPISSCGTEHSRVASCSS
jgi:hypothetical protein